MAEGQGIAQEFSFLRKDADAVILFGSRAKKTAGKGSDIDICVVAPKKKPHEIMRKVWQQGLQRRYDVRVFEEMPLRARIEVITRGKVLWARDRPSLSYYFYFYRKLWKDQQQRNEAPVKRLLSKAR